MSFHTQECPKCGATAYELPDEDGRMICAVCGTQAVADDDECESLADEYDREVPRPRHRVHVRGMRARPVPEQLSERIAHAGRTDRDSYDLDDDDFAW